MYVRYLVERESGCVNVSTVLGREWVGVSRDASRGWRGLEGGWGWRGRGGMEDEQGGSGGWRVLGGYLGTVLFCSVLQGTVDVTMILSVLVVLLIYRTYLLSSPHRL